MRETNIRSMIVDSLLEIEKDHAFLSDIIKSALGGRRELSARDRAFYKKVLFGTTEQRIRIDYVLNLFSNKPVKDQKPYIRAVLRMSVYQILEMDSVPDRAACDEAVRLVKSRGFTGLAGFVNGVLRNISRSRSDISWPDRSDVGTYLSVMYSAPTTVVELLTGEFGEVTAEKILAESIADHPVSVRIRTPEEAAGRLREAWDRAGIEYKPNPYIPGAYFLDAPGRIEDIPGYSDGSFVVQGMGSMLVALLGVRGCESSIMDLCAAPGGKSIHVYDILCKPTVEPKDESGKLCKHDANSDKLCKPSVKAFDISRERMSVLEENIRRLGMSASFETKVMDASEYCPDYEESADLVILDAPCSGLGVMGRKPDIKYRVTPDDIGSLSALQRSIIGNAVRYVKPGGRLVYSTCTLDREENDSQAEYIRDNFSFDNITAGCLEKACPGMDELKQSLTPEGGLMLIPGVFPSDGFYIAVFEKTGV